MPRKKGNKPMLPTSPATPPAPVEEKKAAQPLDKTQKLQHEFIVLLTQTMSRAKELDIHVQYGPPPDKSGIPRGDSQGMSGFKFDGIHLTGKVEDGLLGVVFLPKKLFAVGDNVMADGAGAGVVTSYNGRSPASGLPEWQVLLQTGETRNFRQDQLKK